MDDTPEVIRQQMEETKSQIAEKLETLELQVSETVESTSAAVSATVEAVQETVETVTEAVQDAVQNVSSIFDIRRHIQQHPLWALGGALAVGYVAADYLKQPKQRLQTAVDDSTHCHQSEPANVPSAEQATQPPLPTAAIAAAYEAGRETSSWLQLRGLANTALVTVVQELAHRGIPPIAEFLLGGRTHSRTDRSLANGKRHSALRSQASPEEGDPRLHIASYASARSRRQH